ncbi:hypothetical protein V7S43_007158 [Phytophthora oleae]|uniref:PX domain-containing protein n=1 Tax=Phytophthora oleae TaxID=2107226 RepID=A0ABD3FMQ8_9STRA
MATPPANNQAVQTRARANCKVSENTRPQSLDNGKSRHSSYLLQSHHSLPVSLSPSSSGRQSSCGFIPGHEIVNVSARLVGIERDENRCVYRMVVDTGSGEFSLQKQFSDFRLLRDHLLLDGKALGVSTTKQTGSECKTGACRELAQHLRKFNFPRRRLRDIMSGSEDVRTAMKRQTQLQHFLDVVLAVYRMAPKRQVRRCVNCQCHVFRTIQSFFGINVQHDQISDWKAVSYQTSDEIASFDTPQSTALGSSRTCIANKDGH